MTECVAIYLKEDGSVEMAINGIGMTMETGITTYFLYWETPEDYENFLKSLPSVDAIPDIKAI